MRELEGKVALVTGGGNGVGQAIAKELADAGASVVVNDLGGDWHGVGSDDRPASRTRDEITAAGGTAVADHGDVSQSADARAMVERAVDTYGRLDAVVNSAGILRDGMIFSLDEADWDAVIKVHLRGHFCVTQAACSYWRRLAKETGAPANGRVVSFTSDAGLYGNTAQANYAAAKGGIVSFAVGVAREMQKYGVTSNAIAPRARTRMTENTFGDLLPSVEGGFDSWDPANVAGVVTFLVSDAGAPYTGQILVAGAGVLQAIAPFSVAAEVQITDHKPTQEEIAAFMTSACGPEAGPAPFPIPIAVPGTA